MKTILSVIIVVIVVMTSCKKKPNATIPVNSMSAIINGANWSSNNITFDSASGVFAGFSGANIDTVDIQIPYINFTTVTAAAYSFRPTDISTVSFVHFTGNQVSNLVILNWTTATEANEDHFDIERSTDGITYTVIGQVAAVGNSSSPTNYSFTDQLPVPGMEYYRIKAVDLSSTYVYSITIGASVKEAFAYYNHNKGYNGTIQIASTDTTSHSIMGTFSFDCTDTALSQTVHVRNGQFNIQY